MRTIKPFTPRPNALLIVSLGAASLLPAPSTTAKDNPLETPISLTIKEDGKTTSFEKLRTQPAPKPSPTPSLQSQVTVTPTQPATAKPAQMPEAANALQPPSLQQPTQPAKPKPQPFPKPSPITIQEHPRYTTPESLPTVTLDRAPTIIQAGTSSAPGEKPEAQPRPDSNKKPKLPQFLIDETDDTIPPNITKPQATPTHPVVNLPNAGNSPQSRGSEQTPQSPQESQISTSPVPTSNPLDHNTVPTNDTPKTDIALQKDNPKNTSSDEIPGQNTTKPALTPPAATAPDITKLPAKPEITKAPQTKPLPGIEKLQIATTQKEAAPAIQDTQAKDEAQTPTGEYELNQLQIQTMIEQLTREANQKRAEKSLPIPNPRKVFIEFTNRPFSEVLRLLAEDAGFNYIEPNFGASKAGSALISTRLLNITPLEAFIKIASSRGFTIVNKDGYTTLTRPDIINPEFLIVNQYHLRYTNAKRAAQKIANLLNIKIKPPTDGIDTYPVPNKQAMSFGGASGGSNSGGSTSNTTSTNTSNITGNNSNIGLPTAPRWTSGIPFNEPAYTLETNAGKNGAPTQGDTPALWIDATNNAIIVRTTRENHQMILNHIVDLDVPEAQIEIDTKLIEVTFTDGLKAGTDWTNVFSKGITPSIDLTKIPIKQLLTATGGSSVILDTNQLSVTLQAFQSLSNSNVLNMPKMITQSGVPTHISSTSTRSLIGQNTANNNNVTTTPTTTFTTGTTIDLVPTILDDGRIEININPSVASSIDEGIKDPNGNSVPTVLQRSMTTSAIIPNGTTMIIGGLVQAGTTENEGGLPGLSKIPLVGRTIFGNTAKTKTKTTLLIFCTARIIPPEKTPQVYGDRMQWDAMKRSDSETIKTRLTPTRSSKTNTPSVPDKINQR